MNRIAARALTEFVRLLAFTYILCAISFQSASNSSFHLAENFCTVTLFCTFQFSLVDIAHFYSF